jgi:hypothetical protein
MAFDPVRQEVVLFGGCADDACLEMLGDTWVWNGSTWSQQSSALSPPKRSDHVMASDGSGNVVLFGGSNLAGYPNDTWIWDTTKWVEQHPGTMAPPWVYSAMATNKGGGTVQFGGGGSLIRSHDTWIWR